MPKVLLPIGDATEVLDTMYPGFRLPEDDFEVVVAGPEARCYHMVMHEIPPGTQWDITRERPGYHIEATVPSGMSTRRTMQACLSPVAGLRNISATMRTCSG